MKDTSQQSKSGEMQPRSTQPNFLTSISSVRDFLASLFQSLERGEDSMMQEVQCFLKLQESLKKNGLRFFSLKTLQGFSLTTKGKRSEQSFQPLMNWGMMQNGKCLTADILFHRQENVSSLLDILEANPESKYYLSEKYMEYLKRNLPPTS